MSAPVISTPPAPISREQAITDVLESIALEEAALAHILNAEGEKIQRALTLCTGNVNDLVKINESVKETIQVIIKLQMLLQFKLENVQDL